MRISAEPLDLFDEPVEHEPVMQAGVVRRASITEQGQSGATHHEHHPSGYVRVDDNVFFSSGTAGRLDPGLSLVTDPRHGRRESGARDRSPSVHSPTERSPMAKTFDEVVRERLIKAREKEEGPITTVATELRHHAAEGGPHLG